MEQEFSSRRLLSTHWSEIASDRQDRQEKGRDALGRLVTHYQPALLAHLGFKFRATEDAAQDLLQSFVAEKIVENELLAQANPAKGRCSVSARQAVGVETQNPETLTFETFTHWVIRPPCINSLRFPDSPWLCVSVVNFNLRFLGSSLRRLARQQVSASMVILLLTSTGLAHLLLVSRCAFASLRLCVESQTGSSNRETR